MDTDGLLSIEICNICCSLLNKMVSHLFHLYNL